MDRLKEGYLITKGFGFDYWRERLLQPGGGVLSGWQEQDDLFVQALTGDFKPGSDYRKRWHQAQKAEARFWRTWRKNLLYKHVSLEEFWREVLAKSGGDLPEGSVLDLGCGPVSVLNFIRAKHSQPLGLDPLAATYVREGLIEGKPGWDPIPIIALPAEQLPLPSKSLDHVICFNVLDHVANAEAVLSEIHRVLKPGGTLRTYVHTFSPWIKNLLFFDTPHTYHWDHEEFKHLVVHAGFTSLHELKEIKTFDLPRGLWSRIKHFPYWFATKVAFTSYFLFQRG